MNRLDGIVRQTERKADTGRPAGEGEAEQDWTPQEVDWPQTESSDSTAVDFAPQGPPRFHDRIRNKIPEPLKLKRSNKQEALARIHDTCAVSCAPLSAEVPGVVGYLMMRDGALTAGKGRYQCENRQNRQRAIQGTVWIYDHCVSAVERTQRTVIHLRLEPVKPPCPER